MDYDHALSTLERYIQAIQEWRAEPMLRRGRKRAALNAMVPEVNHILRELAPDLGQVSTRFAADHAAAERRIQVALDLLAGTAMMLMAEQEIQPPERFGPLDPDVYVAWARTWPGGHYRSAVADAASAVNLLAQDRLGRHDISDKDLMSQAFSDKKPEPGKARLRCPGDHRSMAVRSMQQGALLMSQGVFQAIRNPAHHMTGDWNPVTAFEHLAALSIVARWVRHWDVVVYAPSPSDLNAIMAKYQKPLAQPGESAVQNPPQTVLPTPPE